MGDNSHQKLFHLLKKMRPRFDANPTKPGAMEGLLEEFTQAIDGLDIQFDTVYRDQKGHAITLLEAVARDAVPLTIHLVMEALIKGGARLTIDHAEIEAMIHHNVDGAARNLMTVIGREQARGYPTYDRNGDNLLHLLMDMTASHKLISNCHLNYMDAAGYALNGISQIKNDAQSQARGREWVCETRGQDGRNPLGILWANISSGHAPEAVKWDTQDGLKRALSVTQTMLGMGADMLAKDYTGHSALDYLLQAMEKYGINLPNDEVWAPVVAESARSALERGTEVVSGGLARKPGRL